MNVSLSALVVVEESKINQLNVFPSNSSDDVHNGTIETKGYLREIV